MDKSKLCFFLLLFSLAACHNRPSGPDETDAGTGVKADTLLDLEKYRGHFRFRNNLNAIPFTDNDPSDTSAHFVLDSLLVRTVYQDSFWHYFPSEVGGGGNQFYGYIDTFKHFNLICMFTGRGDGGDVYDLLTYTKSGRRIASLQAAWLQGEEDVWTYDQRALVTGRKINVYATACRTTFDSTGIAVGSVCDTLRSYYQLMDNGEITLLKKDSVLNPALDSIRKAIPYN